MPTHARHPIEILRFNTCGLVDDGKSTLIGRLLYDSKNLMEDQLEALERSADITGGGTINLANLTDGLRAEREQGITIDVAYRYFATPRRKFIVADTPGHEQYTRNMATGASNSDLAVILIDARKGVLTQTRRHAYIASLLGIRHIVLAVNKIDLMDYSQTVFDKIGSDFHVFSARLNFASQVAIPISARFGVNVIEKSKETPWYSGPALLSHLEVVDVDTALADKPFRLPVQWVNRPNLDFRGFSGTIAGGKIKPGDMIAVAKSGRTSKVTRIVTMDGDLPEAVAGDAITLTLADEVDISRGDVLSDPHARPVVSDQFAAHLLWMADEELLPGRQYLLKLGTATVPAQVSVLKHKIDVNVLDHLAARTLALNEVGYVNLSLAQPLAFDPYRENRDTGGFILIDRFTNATVGAAMIYEARHQLLGTVDSENAGTARVNKGALTLPERQQRHGHGPAILLVEGRDALARQLERSLFERGFEVLVLEGDPLSSEALLPLLNTLWSAGLLVIYSCQAIRQADRDAIKALAADYAFDLAALQLPSEDREAVRQVLALTESLHTEIRSEDRRTVN